MKKPAALRKELVDLIHEAINQHELARDFYHKMAHLATKPETREIFEFLERDAEENKARLRQCLTPEGCPVVPPAHDAHLAEHLKTPPITPDLSPKDALALAIKRSEALVRFYQTLAELQTPGEIRSRLEYLAKAELSHKEKLEYLYDNVAFPEVW